MIFPIREKGSALVVTMISILAMVILVGVAVNVTQSVIKQTGLSRDYTDLRYESEGALESAYGMWLKVANSRYGAPASADFDVAIRGPLPTTQISPFRFPYAPSGQLKIDFCDQYGAPLASGEPAAIPISLPNYRGWKGVEFSYTASVRLAASAAANAKTYGLKRTINYVSVPLFQAMGFFEGDIELYKPAPMIIAGLVHTNGSAFMSSGTAIGLKFLNNTSNVNGFHTTDQYPVGATAWNNTGANYVPAFANGGQAAQVSTVDRMEPLGTDPAGVLNKTDDNTNNDSMRELIEPPDPAYTDPSAISGRRLYNKAGIIIKVTGVSSGVVNSTVTAANGVVLTSAQVTAIKSALSAQSITDRRENKTVDITTLDVSLAKTTLDTNLTVNPNNSVVYIYDSSSAGENDPKAIRLKNGGILPVKGLTVASEDPIYIQGDYNTGSTPSTVNNVPSNNGGNASNTDSPVVPGYIKPPSAVIGDAVTILSNSWNDSNSAAALSSRPASHTTVNTAIISGNVPSGWTNDGTVAAYGYSGGFNNFPRFLEDWSTGTKSFTYFGSMVQLYNSKIFTGEWDTGNIYGAPNRAWNFDSAFLATPPPGSLDVITRTRGELVRF